MALQLLSFSTLMTNSAAAVQASCARVLDLTAGSVLRAILEASASCGLWMQWLILQVLATTRAATSAGADLDTWIGDYGLTRLPAVPATGTVTFSRYTATNAATVPIGTQVRTSDGSTSFLTTGALTIAAGVASGSASVAAVVGGSAGNVQAGTVTLIASAVPGVDTVTNAAPFTNGVDAESDAAVRARFQGWIAGLSRATRAAIGYAISSTQQGMAYTLGDCVNPDGSANGGFFFAVVDDGSGAPSSAVLAAVGDSVEAYRALGVQYAVYGPTLETATITLTVTIAAGYDGPTVRAAVKAAILALVDGLSIGQALPFYRVAAVAFGAHPGVANVSAVTVNGGTADLAASSLQVIRATTSSVVVS